MPKRRLTDIWWTTRILRGASTPPSCQLGCGAGMSSQACATRRARSRSPQGKWTVRRVCVVLLAAPLAPRTSFRDRLGGIVRRGHRRTDQEKTDGQTKGRDRATEHREK